MSSANNDSFTSSFPIWMAFISPFCLITASWTSTTMWNKSGKGGQPCFVPDLKGHACNFFALSRMLALGFTGRV